MSTPTDRVLVWDAVVRALHWSLAATVLFDFVYDDGGRVHRAVGYAATAIVALRLLWAAVVRGAARFELLKPSPRATLVYCRALLRGRAARHPAHDPLGLWMVWLIWTLVLSLGLTGWMSRLDAFWGDETVQGLHLWLSNVLLAAVVLHLAGVATMSILWRENLPAGMLSGRKRRLDGTD